MEAYTILFLYELIVVESGSEAFVSQMNFRTRQSVSPLSLWGVIKDCMKKLEIHKRIDWATVTLSVIDSFLTFSIYNLFPALSTINRDDLFIQI